MTTTVSRVFFYGLFMDESLLAARDIRPIESTIGYIDGLRLVIGHRATLLPEANSRTYGVLMKISSKDVTALYCESGVADYIAESVVVTVAGNHRVSAICYTLPEEKLSGTNREYAAALLKLATRLGLPDSYLGHIRKSVADA